MKYCANCGSQLYDNAVVCINCGCATGASRPAKSSGAITATKVFMILGTIVMGLTGYLIPLAWCIPMTVVYFKKIKNNQPISTAFKICSLLFVSLVAGILMLCDKDN